MNKPLFILALLAFFVFQCALPEAFSQVRSASPSTPVVVDDQGVMRWGKKGEELQGFGVNYTVPFAHAYRSAKKLGLDPLEEIDRDIYHLSRLGFDLFRVHVWDTEISDTLGNLIYNERFHAFDYLLHQLSLRGFHYVLTPIAFWGNGWPEPDEPTPGFSAKFGKGNCLTDPAAMAAQENYLLQFMNHVNPYTGIAYKDDPRLVAVEISNEPHHREAPELVAAFVGRMVKAVKKSGYRNPIFYNISHSVHLVDDYFEGGINGGTFQWYPTGLGYQRELPGNVLPAVDRYEIPFDDRIRAHKGAKLVYEFDAADIGRSYVYPAMARSFREAGIQIATHFAYDPMYLAYANTEYNTHFMNLAYTPQKALALKISGEVFRQVPMYADLPSYPKNTTFGAFSIDATADLAMLNDGTRYFHSNNTQVAPLRMADLREIAGYGTSTVVEYQGTGAYFLDRLAVGVWRLEVMPDALITQNPYGRNSLNKTVAVVQWNTRDMQISLPDLGENFQLAPLNPGNTHQAKASQGQVTVAPGAYLLTAAGISSSLGPESPFRNMRLGEFEAPADGITQLTLLHTPTKSAPAGRVLPVTVQVAGPERPTSVELMVMGQGRPLTIELVASAGFAYEGIIPAERMRSGLMEYYLVVRMGEQVVTFPAAASGLPFEWDFYARNPYRVRVIDINQPITLFEAESQAEYVISSRWGGGQRLIPGPGLHESSYRFATEGLFRPDPENLNAPQIQDVSMRYPIGDRLGSMRELLASKTRLTVVATGENQPVQVALIMANGDAFGTVITIRAGQTEYDIPLSELSPVKTVILPRPYPTFLPYYFQPLQPDSFDITQVESLQISYGPGLAPEKASGTHVISLTRVLLQ